MELTPAQWNFPPNETAHQRSLLNDQCQCSARALYRIVCVQANLNSVVQNGDLAVVENYTNRGKPAVIRNQFAYIFDTNLSLDNKRWKCIHYTDCKAYLWLHVGAIVKEAGLHTHEEEPETIAARKRVQQYKVDVVAQRLLSSIAAILMHINLLRIFELQLTVKRWALGAQHKPYWDCGSAGLL